ncbi:MAG: ATPase, T2SS/T4P/T4SS family [Acidimicrobiales bacterium]|nr:ATPase, T2SS/T4P/T4SS family [Acidimicrobiales bacterium]
MLPDARRAAVVDAIHAHLLTSDPTSTGDRRRVLAAVREGHPLLSDADVAAVASAVTARATGLGPLETILLDPSVSEVMVNGTGPVWIERHGRLEATDLHIPHSDVELLIERIVAPLGLRADRSSPIADARLADGSRVNVIVPPLAIDGPCLTIRRFGARAVPLDELCPPGVEALLAWAVLGHANVMVSGGTGAGKTTLLNALGALLPRTERLVTVEDTAELRLPGDHVVRLEARPATADGLGVITIRQLVRNALRMRPDRLLVGEVRGAEAVDMLWAMNTGHEGSLSTCHANSPVDALRRLEVMVLSAGLDLPLDAVRDQLTAALDLVVHVARLEGGRRGVVAVHEVLDPPAPSRTRPLADADGLHQLPLRPPRRPVPAADTRWCR